MPSAVETRRPGINALSKSCSLWELEGGLDRPSVLSSARKGLGCRNMGGLLVENLDNPWVPGQKILNSTQPLFFCGLQGVLEVLMKPEKPLVRGVQLLEGKKRRGLAVLGPLVSPSTPPRGTGGFLLTLLLLDQDLNVDLRIRDLGERGRVLGYKVMAFFWFKKPRQPDIS